jgi:hypothetical protein
LTAVSASNPISPAAAERSATISLVGSFAKRRGWDTARHESCHIVLANLLSVPVHSASVVEDKDSKGRVYFALPEERPENRLRSSKGAPLNDVRQAVRMIVLAHGRMPWRELLGRARELRTRAGCLVSCVPRHWNQVIALEAELLKNGEMDARAIAGCIAAADAAYDASRKPAGALQEVVSR